jgi:dihydropteroate synthase
LLICYPKNNGYFECNTQLFFDGGKYKNETEILSQVEKMLLDGATFIDVGAIPANQMQNLYRKEEISRIVQ